MNTGEGLHRFVDPVDGGVYLYSQFETADAKRMFTCFDQPDLKATYELTVLVPASWKAISNTPITASEEDRSGAVRHVFATTELLSTYLVALVAGPYTEWRDEFVGETAEGPVTIPLGLYCRASLADHMDADRLFAETKQGFGYYHRAFGVRYPFGKYDQCFVPEFNAGAMENAGCVTFLEDYVFRSRVTRYLYERRCETVLHEMAHMWFGDLVTMRWWDDLWLNESFATFASVLAQAEATEYEHAWTTFANIEKSWAYRQDQLPSTHPVAADIPDLRGRRGQLRRHHLRQGRQRPQAAGRLRRPGQLPGGAAGLLREARLGQRDPGRPADRAGGGVRPGPVRLGRAVAADHGPERDPAAVLGGRGRQVHPVHRAAGARPAG